MLKTIPEEARKNDYFSYAVELISEKECRQGIAFLFEHFYKVFPDPTAISLIPILRGGAVLGDIFSANLKVEQNPIWMSLYPPGEPMRSEPACLQKPDLNKITMGKKSKSVVFVDAVIDTGRSIQWAQKQVIGDILEYSQTVGYDIELPKFYVYSLMTKLKPDTIPNICSAFFINPSIWVAGWGCDLEDQGRENRNISAVPSPYATKMPELPYYTQLMR